MRNLLTTCILLFFSLQNITTYAINSIETANNLLKRIAPTASHLIVFEQLNNDNDVFEIETINNKIIIRGNNANSMAVGLNHYLKYYCLTNVSWYAADPIELPDTLPLVTNKINVESRVKNRFFLNYCTFGYTMPWWHWEDWERFIDWMALNGINLPLAITGQEAIWYNVWKDLGMSDEQIRSYFTGPAHLPWHRMSNLDYWQGSLPLSWLESQKELQIKILQRERELNMRPVLPAFSGHVPKELKNIFPQAHITQMSSWGGFKDEYRSHFLDPLDPLFKDIQNKFLTKQTEIFGSDHIYGADPFNEVESPSWEPNYLATVSKTVYESITDIDPKATWLQMTWVFYHDRKHWTNPRIESFLKAVPTGKMLLLDYYCENTEIWRMTDQYFGQPYIWCYLGNFGGNTMLAGNLYEVGQRIEKTFQEGGSNFWGIGSTLEALDVNPIMYEYVFEKAWKNPMPDNEWIKSYADSRVGKKDTLVREAGKLLVDSVYLSPSKLGQGCLTNSRPAIDKRGKWVNPTINYNNSVLFKIWTLLLTAEGHKRDSYNFDLTNIGRQLLGNHFSNTYNEFINAYHKKDINQLLRKKEEMIELLNDLDNLLGSHQTFSLNNWIRKAKSHGRTKNEENYYEKNARTILTTWGNKDQSLNDYANRQWNGLISSYYLPRWEKFTIQIINSITNDTEFDSDSFYKEITSFEWDWTSQNEVYHKPAKGNSYSIARHLLAKYGIENCYPIGKDSIDINHIQWTILENKFGYTVKTASLNLFNSPQTISVIEFSPSNSLDFIQLDSCNKTSFAAKEIKAKAAINGSYFDISNCVPTTYINISGKEMSVDKPKESFRVNGILVIKDYKLEIHNIDSIAAMIEG